MEWYAAFINATASVKAARTQAIIAALTGVQDDARHFQIREPAQPGNSGGALVDERGNVVGVVSAKVFADGHRARAAEVSARLKDANTKERKFEDVVKSAEQAAVLVLVY